MLKQNRWIHVACTLALCLAGLEPTARAAPIYAALGASDALGYGASNYNPSDPSQPNNGYVYLIHDWLRARYAPWQLRNFAGSGYPATTIRDQKLPLAIAAKPAIVTVWVGGNDVKDSVLQGQTTAGMVAQFEPAFTTIIRRLREETGAFIVTANLPDMSRIPIAAWFDATYRQKGHDDSVALNEVIARVAGMYGVPVIDLYADPESYNAANYSSDGFHPSDAGYARIALKFEAVLAADAGRLLDGLGDVNGDGSVSVTDAGETLRMTGGLVTTAGRASTVADTYPVGGDARIGMEDAVRTLRRATGLVPDTDWR